MRIGPNVVHHQKLNYHIDFAQGVAHFGDVSSLDTYRMSSNTYAAGAKKVLASFVFYLHVAVISSYISFIAISEQNFSCDFWSCPIMFCSHPQYYVLCDVNAAYAYTGCVLRSS